MEISGGVGYNEKLVIWAGLMSTLNLLNDLIHRGSIFNSKLFDNSRA
jgi:hypothetical protein